MSYFKKTLFILIAAVACSAVVAIAAFTWATGQRRDLEAKLKTRSDRAATVHKNSKIISQKQADNAQPAQFLSAWQKHIGIKSEAEVGNYLRSELTNEANKLRLTAEDGLVPSVTDYALSGRKIKVQKVSIAVVDNALLPVLSWLGQIESKFPFARIEQVKLGAYGRSSVKLSVTLAYWVNTNSAK